MEIFIKLWAMFWGRVDDDGVTCLRCGRRV